MQQRPTAKFGNANSSYDINNMTLRQPTQQSNSPHDQR